MSGTVTTRDHIEAVAAAPSEPSPDPQRMLVQPNVTTVGLPLGACVHRLFEQQAHRDPDATAVVHGQRRLSYGALNAAANRVARHLRALGIASDSLVGIFMQRQIEMIVAILAVLKAGGAYLPLDPGYPAARLAGMMNDVELKVVLTSETLADRLPAARDRTLSVDRISAATSALSSDDIAEAPALADLAYVIFTSGSTGKPKAAGVHHQGWLNLMSWFVREFAIGPLDKVLVISSFGFDITQRSIAMPLVAGGRLILLASDLYDPELISRTIREEQVTLLNCAPSTFYPLVENRGQTVGNDLASLRTVFLGGEAISASRLREWAQSSRTEIINVYGAAECSDVSSFYRLSNYGQYIRTSVPIGKEIANSQLRLLGEDLRPVPFGAVGEICIAGAGLGRGYINDAKLTADKFVQDPLDEPGARLYRTGDLGRCLPDGNLQYVGRIDQQIKLRGFRIHLGDIESNLRRCPLVREAVVLKKAYGLDDERLVAYIVPSAPATAADLRSEIKAFARDRLPEYMVPAAVTILDAMPLNPNGKVDRAALLDRASDVDVGTSATEQSRSRTEADLRAIFAEALSIDAVAAEDDFFDLGGDSLKAVLVVGTIKSRLGLSVPLESVFEARTARKLAERVDAVPYAKDR